jgi:uncharacterized membrane protein YfcA
VSGPLVVGAAAAAGVITHARAGRVRFREGAVFGLLGIAGSVAGSRASAAVPAGLLLAGFGVLMLAVAAAMIVRAHSVADRPHRGRHPLVVAAAAIAVGLITGFFAIGGGFVIVPALVLVLGFDMPAAAGTSLMVIAIDSAAALAARAGLGGLAVNWVLTGVFGTASLAGALAGGRVSGRASPRRLSKAFTVLIVAVAGYTLARSLLHLG